MLCCWLRPTKPQTALTPSSTAASRTLSRKSRFFSRGAVVMQQVVEVRQVGDADAARLHRRADTRGARRIEGAAQVERVGHRIEHRLGRHVGQRRMQRRRQLDVARAQLAGEVQPVFDGAIGIGIPHVARRQLLERGGQHADLHEFRGKRGDGHPVDNTRRRSVCRVASAYVRR